MLFEVQMNGPSTQPVILVFESVDLLLLLLKMGKSVFYVCVCPEAGNRFKEQSQIIANQNKGCFGDKQCSLNFSLWSCEFFKQFAGT